MLGLEADGVKAIGDGETAEQEIVDSFLFSILVFFAPFPNAAAFN